jgi:hypothetical protein
MKIRLLGTDFFQVNGETDRQTKLIVAYRNSATAPKNGFPANITLSFVGLWGIGHCDD